jgi:tetraacyldisaccharide 4'-kinase
VYSAGVSLRNAAYDRGWAGRVRLPCPVISIGNLTVGGTGKTACVELIVRALQARGCRAAVLSRGYGGARSEYELRAEGDRLLMDGAPAASLEGLADEPQLLARHLPGIPVLVGARRDRSGRRACEAFGAQALVLDDGFQHRRVRRDCDIVLVTARMPFDGWALLPRGPMREPLSSLRRADVIIVTKADEALGTLGALTERLQHVAPDAAVATAVHEPAQLLDPGTGVAEPPGRLEGLRVGLVSSIGDPEGFETTVRRLQGQVVWHQALPDHHAYDAADWAALRERVRMARPQAVVTTEKDWVRLQPVAGEPLEAPLRVLTVRLRLLSGEDALHARLDRLLAR